VWLVVFSKGPFMNNCTLPGAMVLLCAPLLGQGSMTTPPGGLTREGSDYAAFFGAYAGARFQQIDGMHPGRNTTSITQIAFRLDYRDHDATTAMGRSWTRITLDISETTNYREMSYLLGRNITMTPTRVFASQWSWPAQTGFPRSRPDRWGGVTGDLRFPFTKPWVYTGKDDILVDYVFRGGTLANQGAWSGSNHVAFYLDNELFKDRKQSKGLPLPLLSGSCADSGVGSSTARAYANGHAYSYGPSSGEITLRNKLRLQHDSYFTAPNAPVVHALGLGGSHIGVDLGARCYLLYVDFSKPVVLVPLNTSSDGYSGLMGWVVPWDDEFRKQQIYIQAAWADSKTRAFSLSAAMRVTLPDGLPLALAPRVKTAYTADPDAGYATDIPGISNYAFPFTEYRTR